MKVDFFSNRDNIDPIEFRGVSSSNIWEIKNIWELKSNANEYFAKKTASGLYCIFKEYPHLRKKF